MSVKSISYILNCVVSRKKQTVTKAVATYKDVAGVGGGEGTAAPAADSKGQQSGMENEYF